jgi:hypothetical protein
VITIRPSGGRLPAGLSATLELATLREYIFGVFNYYQLVTLVLSMVCLTVALTERRTGVLPQTSWQKMITVEGNGVGCSKG